MQTDKTPSCRSFTCKDGLAIVEVKHLYWQIRTGEVQGGE